MPSNQQAHASASQRQRPAANDEDCDVNSDCADCKPRPCPLNQKTRARLLRNQQVPASASQRQQPAAISNDEGCDDDDNDDDDDDDDDDCNDCKPQPCPLGQKTRARLQRNQQPKHTATSASTLLEKIQKNIEIDGFLSIRTVSPAGDGIRVLRTRKVVLGTIVKRHRKMHTTTTTSLQTAATLSSSLSTNASSSSSSSAIVTNAVTLPTVSLCRALVPHSSNPLLSFKQQQPQRPVAHETDQQVISHSSRLCIRCPVFRPHFPFVANAMRQYLRAQSRLTRVPPPSSSSSASPSAVTAPGSSNLLIRWLPGARRYCIERTAREHTAFAPTPVLGAVVTQPGTTTDRNRALPAPETTAYLHESQISMATLPTIILTEQTVAFDCGAAVDAVKSKLGAIRTDRATARARLSPPAPTWESDSESTLSAVEGSDSPSYRTAAAIVAAATTTTTITTTITTTTTTTTTTNSSTSSSRSSASRFLDTLQIPDCITIISAASKRDEHQRRALQTSANAKSTSGPQPQPPVVIFTVSPKHKRQRDDSQSITSKAAPANIANSIVYATTTITTTTTTTPSISSSSTSDSLNAFLQRRSGPSASAAPAATERALSCWTPPSDALHARCTDDELLLPRRAPPTTTAAVSPQCVVLVNATTPAQCDKAATLPKIGGGCVPARGGHIVMAGSAGGGSVGGSVRHKVVVARPTPSTVPEKFSIVNATRIAQPSAVVGSRFGRARKQPAKSVKSSSTAAEVALTNQVFISLVQNVSSHRPTVASVVAAAAASVKSETPPSVAVPQPPVSPNQLLDTDICAECCGQGLATGQYFDHQNVSLFAVGRPTPPTPSALVPRSSTTSSSSTTATGLSNGLQLMLPVIQISSDSDGDDDDDDDDGYDDSKVSKDAVTVWRPQHRHAGTQCAELDIARNLAGPSAFTVPGPIKAIRCATAANTYQQSMQPQQRAQTYRAPNCDYLTGRLQQALRQQLARTQHGEPVRPIMSAYVPPTICAGAATAIVPRPPASVQPPPPPLPHLYGTAATNTTSNRIVLRRLPVATQTRCAGAYVPVRPSPVEQTALCIIGTYLRTGSSDDCAPMIAYAWSSAVTAIRARDDFGATLMPAIWNSQQQDERYRDLLDVIDGDARLLRMRNGGMSPDRDPPNGGHALIRYNPLGLLGDSRTSMTHPDHQLQDSMRCDYQLTAYANSLRHSFAASANQSQSHKHHEQPVDVITPGGAGAQLGRGVTKRKWSRCVSPLVAVESGQMPTSADVWPCAKRPNTQLSNELDEMLRLEADQWGLNELEQIPVEQLFVPADDFDLSAYLL